MNTWKKNYQTTKMDKLSYKSQQLDTNMTDLTDATKVMTLLDNQTVEDLMLSGANLDAFQRTDHCLQLFMFMAKELKKEHRKTALTRLEEWWLRDNNGDVKRVWYANSIEKTVGIKDGKVPGKNGFIQRSDKNKEVIEREVLDAFYKYGSADTEIRISHRNTE